MDFNSDQMALNMEHKIMVSIKMSDLKCHFIESIFWHNIIMIIRQNQNGIVKTNQQNPFTDKRTVSMLPYPSNYN